MKGQHFYDKLPIHIKKKFKEGFAAQNSEISFEEYLQLEFDSHSAFISGVDTEMKDSLGTRFRWYKTKGGFDYWEIISQTEY